MGITATSPLHSPGHLQQQALIARLSTRNADTAQHSPASPQQRAHLSKKQLLALGSAISFSHITCFGNLRNALKTRAEANDMFAYMSEQQRAYKTKNTRDKPAGSEFAFDLQTQHLLLYSSVLP